MFSLNKIGKHPKDCFWLTLFKKKVALLGFVLDNLPGEEGEETLKK